MRKHIAEEDNFATFVLRVRQEKDIPMSDLCRGICSKSEIHKIESNEGNLSKLAQDIIVSRLGVCIEDSEVYLGYDEYDAWLLRTNIIHYIMRRDYEKADELIERYGEEYLSNSKLDEQYYYRMRSYILEHNGFKNDIVVNTISEALNNSVPGIMDVNWQSLILSIQELDMLLDINRLSEISIENKIAKYSEIIEYIKNRDYEKRLRARIFPKAVYLCAKSIVESKENSGLELLKILKLIDEAVEDLRNAASSYYLIELINVREEICGDLGEASNYSSLDENLDYTKLKNAMLRLYDEAGVPVGIENSAFIYMTKCTSCLNDVIRARRKMLKMKQSELAEGICDIKTISRIENRKSVPQRAIMYKLLERLNLPKAYIKNELVFADNELYKKLDDFRKCINQVQLEEANTIFEEIVNKDEVICEYNKQYILRVYNIIKKNKDSISVKEFIDTIKEIIELTIEYDILFESSEMYFTSNERVLYRDIVNHTEDDDKERIMSSLCEYSSKFQDEGLKDAFIRDIEFLYCMVQSELANMGKIEESDMYIIYTLNLQLNNYRICDAEELLYSMWWNHQKAYSEEETIQLMLDCLAIDCFIRDVYGVNFIKNKINRLSENN